MRILYITPSLQHPKMRGATRHYHFIRELSKRHSITLLSLIRSTVEPEALAEMESYTEKLLTFNINGESASNLPSTFVRLPLIGDYVEKNAKLRCGVNQMKKAFTNLVKSESYDLVLFHGKSVFPVIENWSGLPIVTDFCDATSLRIRTSMRYNSFIQLPFYFLKLLQMRQLEKKMIEKSPHTAFISCRDREAILGPTDRSAILPLGVDNKFWKRRTNKVEKNCILFTGVMDYSPNHDAAMHLIKKIVPLVKRKISDLQLIVVGRNPKRALREKARHHPEVTITGFVEDIRPYLEKAAVFAAPIRYASGTQNKVLEAMAMEVAVVATPIVSDGLTIDEYGEPPLVKAMDDQEFANCITKLLQDKKQRTYLASEGRSFVERYFSWSSSAAKLEKMCLDAIK